jgi:hypothetical protein
MAQNLSGTAERLDGESKQMVAAGTPRRTRTIASSVTKSRAVRASESERQRSGAARDHAVSALRAPAIERAFARRVATAAASVSNTWSEESQSMQPSVTL